jgi:hypothetical protein
VKGILGKYAERGRKYELGFSGFIGFANPEKPKKPINSIYAFLHITLREPPRITRSICDDCIYFCDHLSIVS